MTILECYLQNGIIPWNNIYDIVSAFKAIYSPEVISLWPLPQGWICEVLSPHFTSRGLQVQRSKA
jgi:hypothetical protein